DPGLLGYRYHASELASPTGLSPPMADPSRSLRLTSPSARAIPRTGPTTPRDSSPAVWAPPLSLAATQGISVDFSSSGYLDVSVPRVCLPLPRDDGPLRPPGFPIRRSMDQGVRAPPHGLSQLATSFLARPRLGIPRARFHA